MSQTHLLIFRTDRPNGVRSSKHVNGQVEHKVDMAAFIFHQSHLNSHTGVLEAVSCHHLNHIATPIVKQRDLVVE